MRICNVSGIWTWLLTFSLNKSNSFDHLYQCGVEGDKPCVRFVWSSTKLVFKSEALWVMQFFSWTSVCRYNEMSFLQMCNSEKQLVKHVCGIKDCCLLKNFDVWNVKDVRRSHLDVNPIRWKENKSFLDVKTKKLLSYLLYMKVNNHVNDWMTTTTWSLGILICQTNIIVWKYPLRVGLKLFRCLDRITKDLSKQAYVIIHNRLKLRLGLNAERHGWLLVFFFGIKIEVFALCRNPKGIISKGNLN